MEKAIKPKAEKSVIVKIKKVENALYIDLHNRSWGHFVVAYNDIRLVPRFLEDAKTGDKVYVIHSTSCYVRRTSHGRVKFCRCRSDKRIVVARQVRISFINCLLPGHKPSCFWLLTER